MPNNRLAIRFDAEGIPTDATTYDSAHSWAGPSTLCDQLEPGERIECYARQLTGYDLDQQVKAEAKARVDAARKILIDAGEIATPTAPE